MPRGRPISFLVWLAVALAPAAAAAQSNVVTPSPPPREGTIGPEQLRDFSLPGTSRPAEPANDSTPAPAPVQEEPARQAAPTSSAPATAPRPSVSTPVAEARPAQRESEPATAPSRQVSLGLEPPAGSATPSFTPTFTPLPAPVVDPVGSDSYAPTTNPPPSTSWWPWLLAGLVAAGAGLWFFRRQRNEHGDGELAFAGGTPAAPPAARPAPAPAAPRPSGTPQGAASSTTVRAFAPRPQSDPPKPAGVVSSRLRPWVELELIAERAVLTDEEAIIYFEVAVLNNGSVPARNIVVEAMAINAGETQDGDIANFYARPDMEGEGIAAVPPLGRVSLRNMVRMPRGAMREYVAEGRTLLVPIVAFNAAYRWSGGRGRSGAAFLVGRGGEDAHKMAPLRLDLGPREFRPLTQRRLDPQVRR